MTRPSRAFWISWLKGLGVAFVVGVFLAISGAFGSDEAPISYRLLYWIVTMLVGASIGGAIAHLFTEWAWFDERPVLRGVLMSIAIALPLTVMVWALTNAFAERPWRLADIRHYFLPVFVVSAAMTALGHLMDRPLQTHAASSESEPSRFLDRLPPRLRGATLRAVQSEDHYLRIHTDRGSELILMRLSDAVAELEGLEGAQVHRSWWVAKGAVRDVRRGDGRAVLTLDDGLEAPVSRRYARALRAAGWW